MSPDPSLQADHVLVLSSGFGRGTDQRRPEVDAHSAQQPDGRS